MSISLKTVSMFKGGEVIVVNDNAKDIAAWVKQGYAIEDTKEAAPKEANNKAAKIAALRARADEEE